MKEQGNGDTLRAERLEQQVLELRERDAQTKANNETALQLVCERTSAAVRDLKQQMGVEEHHRQRLRKKFPDISDEELTAKLNTAMYNEKKMENREKLKNRVLTRVKT